MIFRHTGALSLTRDIILVCRHCIPLPTFKRALTNAGKHTNTEDAYVGCIAATIAKLKMNKPIVCGASMAGQVCLAVAARCEEVGACGTIPLQGSDYLNMERQWHDQSPFVNQSLFAPEWIYGMMSPTAPQVNKQLVWHLYSAQAYGVFHGDLDFYFG